jgi:hypothetical protein
MRSFVSSVLFIPTDEKERKERVVQEMSSTPQHVVVSAFEAMEDYDPIEEGGGLAVPGLYIEANEPQPRSDMVRLHEMLSQILAGLFDTRPHDHLALTLESVHSLEPA